MVNRTVAATISALLLKYLATKVFATKENKNHVIH
jgi:hypothetical protein